MIVCDTAPIVAAIIQSETGHYECARMFTGLRLAGRRLLLPQTVLAEVGYMLQTLAGAQYEASFVRSVADGDFEVVGLDSADLDRMAELTDQYLDLPLGTTDASVVALAERVNVTEIATLDHRHFRVVRPRHIAAFTLLPEGFKA